MSGEARLRRLAWVACAAAVTLTVAGVTLVALARIGTSYEPSQSIVESLPDVLMALLYALVGAIVTLKRPANLVGWALALAGLGSLAGGVASAYGELAVLGRPDLGLPGGTVAAALSPGSWTPLMAGVFLLLVTFPEGTIATIRRQRWVLAVLTGFGVAWVLITLTTDHLDPPLDGYENPLAVPASDLLVACAIPIIVACLLSILVAGVDLVRRFRRSTGLERQQFKWLASSAGFLVATLPFAAAFNWSWVAGAVFGVALITLPISVGLAVLRYRLFEIDRLVSRTLTYGVLTLLLVGVYAGLVLASQALFSSFAGGSNLAIAGSTLVVAALFLPARRRIQRVVDRRFNRHAYDAQRTLEAFGAHLREDVGLDSLQANLRRVVVETMQPASASVWLRFEERAP